VGSTPTGVFKRTDKSFNPRNRRLEGLLGCLHFLECCVQDFAFYGCVFSLIAGLFLDNPLKNFNLKI
jgi:hypothetical protein